MRTVRLGARACVLGILAVGWLGLVSPHSLWAQAIQATLENPPPGSFQSGIGVISGWVCNATLVEIIYRECRSE